MNCSYRSLWNDSTGTFVAVSENASSAGKKTSSGVNAVGIGTRFTLQALAVAVMLACGANALAQPTGGVVAAGAATISTGATSTTINQSTQNAIINWQSFNIATGQSVQFVQPNNSSVALNRVLGADPSNILGSLSANGKVFLVNPNGILFGQGASVNVGGLLASTLNITNSDFLAGNHTFSGNGTGTVLNQGSLNADGGYVALLGANVSNQGTISAQLGSVVLAAGSVMTLDVAGDGLLNIAVNEGAVNALVQNGGLIHADGGQVLLTTQAAGSLLPNAVNNTGVIQAQTLVTGANGSIMLMGGMQSGTVNVGGTLDASAPNGGDGGFIETSAAHVTVANDAKVTTLAGAGKTGTWLIDPTDYTVGAGGDITGAALGTNLDLTNVILQSGAGTVGTLGNVNVNDPVSWTAPTTLTLDAVNDVNINAAVTGINGSVAATAGHDVNVAAATKTTTGNLTFTAVNDVAISAATTVITGNMTAVAGKNVTVSAASTITTGDMIFRADNDGTGPGVAAGTVAITCGSNCLTITTGNLSIRFNPANYTSTGAEIIAYGLNLTGAGVLDAKAWVFGQGDNKMYDGTTAATVSGLKPDALGTPPPAALGVVSNANFDTKHVGTSKPITYNSTFNDAVYDLFAPFGTAVGSYLTRADILVRPLTVSAVTDSRAYNGTTSSVGVPTSLGLQLGDTLNGPLTQAYASKDVMGPLGSTLVATGPYTVTDGNGGGNYTVTVNTAPGTITPAPLTITANDAAKVYGQTATLAPTAFTTTALVNGETVGSVTEVSPGTVATAPVAGSPYAITPSAATGGTFTPGNYTIGYVNGALTITPAPLTITANDASKTYGQTLVLPDTAFTTTGLVNGDAVTSVPETSAGTVASAVVVGSPYAITPGAATGTYDAGNYTVSYVDGKLYVLPVVVPPVVVVPGVVVPPAVVVPPDVLVPPDVVVTPDTPLELPVVKPPIGPNAWPPVVVLPLIPPVLQTLTPPVLAPVPTPIPVAVAPKPEQVEPVIQPEPQRYVAPIRPRKQDRN
ncbi:MAG: hypothetical protein A2503_04675 [Burkholderiales bacterium RIFOXYD12_FULL_59_19]|nr:MAG: hypothetical protein A2503_04675 [Burkholderiales bacterium RIFOXYD12_FULL_59_19]